jgi:hypothetical protein
MLGMKDRNWPSEFWDVEDVSREASYGVIGFLHFIGAIGGFSRRVIGIGAVCVRGNTLRSSTIHGRWRTHDDRGKKIKRKQGKTKKVAKFSQGDTHIVTRRKSAKAVRESYREVARQRWMQEKGGDLGEEDESWEMMADLGAQEFTAFFTPSWSSTQQLCSLGDFMNKLLDLLLIGLDPRI